MSICQPLHLCLIVQNIDVLCLLVEYYRHMDADELPEQSFLFHEFFSCLKPKQTPPATLAPTGPGHWN